MKTAIKKRWVAALRSGKYKQGKRLLKTEDGKYCCLGVLTDLYTKSKVCSPEDKSEWESSRRIDGEGRVLPYKVRIWAGIDESNPDVIAGKDKESLASINDSRPHYGFGRIARVIEKEL